MKWWNNLKWWRATPLHVLNYLYVNVKKFEGDSLQSFERTSFEMVGEQIYAWKWLEELLCLAIVKLRSLSTCTKVCNLQLRSPSTCTKVCNLHLRSLSTCTKICNLQSSDCKCERMKMKLLESLSHVLWLCSWKDLEKDKINWQLF